jgi:uncharacterized protein (DUF342 family)
MGNNTYDGYFNINTKDDGIYVEAFAAKGQGRNIQLQQIESELEKKGINNYNLDMLKIEMGKEYTQIEVKVAERTNLSGKEVKYKIDVSDDKMDVKIVFYPLEDDTYVDPKEIMYNLRQKDIVHGIDENLIKELASSHEYNIPFSIVKGTSPIDGVPGRIEYGFRTNKDLTPEIDEDGNVNYHKLNIIANVKKGDLLARLIPATEGEEGKNIYGNVISPRKAKPIRLRYGKNVAINDNRTELYADEDGLVRLFEGKVIVNNVFDVPNNVGISTGDIEFEGSVIVHGNVITGFTVIAKGDIEVNGVVEGARLKAGGDIILHKGIQGMNKSKIEAGGNIKAKYIENGNVISGGSIHSEAILHSRVSAKGEITVEGKKGMISGGTVRSGVGVSTKTLGSHMGTVTELEVGIDPLMLEEYNNLRRELPKLSDESKKLDQVVTLLNKRKELVGELDDEKQEMYLSAIRNKVFISNKLNVAQKRIDELQEEVNNKNSGYVNVAGIVYPGVKVSIGNYSHYVRDELKFISFYKKGADIKMKSL